MISVALCSYNGEKYIERQLLSILQQTLPVDEVVVCDDGSSDSTITLVEQIRKNNPDKIRVYKNEIPLGVCENFRKATNLCRGDIIFLSDQDDVWHPDKVAIITKYLKKHPSISAVFTDALFIDANGNHEDHYGNLFRMSFHREEQRMFNAGLQLETLLRRNHATGATMAVRATFLHTYHPFDFCTEAFLHDHAIAVKAAEESTLGVIYKPLIDYRRHENQQTGFYLPSKQDGDNWYCYYDHLREYWPAPEHLKTILPIISDLSKERVEYITARNHLLHQFTAPLTILRSHKKYQHLYGKSYRRIIYYDIFQSIRYSILRLFRRTPKN